MSHPDSPTGGPPAGSNPELVRSLIDGYTRYDLSIAGLEAFRQLFDDSDRDPWPRLALGLAVAQSLHARRAGERGAQQDELVAWGDAIVSAVGSIVSILRLDPGRSSGAWPGHLRWAASKAQWSCAGTNVLGRPGIGQLGRIVVIIAPYALWPEGRRRIDRAGLGAATVPAFVLFALGGLALKSALSRTAREIDTRSAELMDAQRLAAERSADVEVRDSVIAVTAERMVAIRDALVDDREQAAVLAAIEERRLRSWIARERPPGERGADPGGEDEHDAEIDRRFGWFLAIAEATLRVASAGQLAIEASRPGRPRSARALAAVALSHAGQRTSRLLRDPLTNRARFVAGDIVMAGLAGAVDLAESRAGGSWGWTEGYAHAAAAASAGPVRTGAVAPRVALLGSATVRGVLAMFAQERPLLPRVARSGREVVSLTLNASLARWFVHLVVGQAERLTSTARELAALRATASADEIRREGQHLVHDSALQVLLWIQKPDLSGDQLLAWLDREIPRLAAAADGTVPQSPALELGVRELVAGFEALGMRIDLDLRADLTAVPTAVATSALEILNEALSNSFKHSPDRWATVVIGSPSGELVVEVGNRLRDPAATAVRPGVGTPAMRGRARSVGGRVDLDQVDGEFRLTAVLPLA